MPRRPRSSVASGLEEIEIECFLLALARRYGYDLRGYDPALVRRQILRRAREEEIESISRLSEQMLRRPEILERFLRQFASPASDLFSPPDFWGAFRQDVVPFLRTYPTLRIWVLGAPAEELYTLSIVLEEDVPRHIQIYATDIHESLLDRARSGYRPAAWRAARGTTAAAGGAAAWTATSRRRTARPSSRPASGSASRSARTIP